MQHEAAASFDRPSLEYLQGFGIFRQLDLVGLLDDVELHQKTGKIDAARRAVDDDAHGAFGRVRAEINHRTLEARVAHDGHGNQQLAIEITMAVGLAGTVGRFAASRSWPEPLCFLIWPFVVRAHPQRLAYSVYPDIGACFCQSSWARD